MNMKTLLKYALAMAICFGSAVWAEVSVPPLNARVTDLTGTLSEMQIASLENGLQAMEARNGSQIAVLLVPTTQPETIEQYSIRVAEAWKLGRKGVDNGLLLLVVKNERKVRIEVGYGLEGVIPDAVAHRIIEESIAPHFKEGRFAVGIHAGLFRLEELIEGQARQSALLQAAKPSVPGALEIPPRGLLFQDLTDTVTAEQRSQILSRLEEYEQRYGKHLFVLVVQTAQPEDIGQLATRTLKTWEARDALDADNSVLLLVSRAEANARIVGGAALQRALGNDDSALQQALQPLLQQGDLAGGIQAGIQQIESLFENEPIPFGERLFADISEFPIWFLGVLVVVGTALRWYLGPIKGGLIMGGATGCGAWLIAGSIETGIIAGIAALIFVLVGVSNWLAIILSTSSGSSGSGGGFSGGGGSFGGGGASGSW